jgi:hypothetical protein
LKLLEIYNTEPRFAWLEPSSGPEDIMGVRLAFLEPVVPRLDSQIEDARTKKDHKREEMFRLRKDNYVKQGQKFFTPDLGWWMSEIDFHGGKPGFNGKTKGNIFQKYPDLKIFPSREAAIKAAEKAGLF